MKAKAWNRMIVDLFAGEPRGVILPLAILVAETCVALIPLWLRLWGFGETALGNSYVRILGWLCAVGFLIAMVPLVFIQHVGRFRRLRKPPLRQILYKSAANSIGLIFALVGLIGTIALGLLAPVLWKLVFHWTVLAFYWVWNREITPSKDLLLANELARVGPRSTVGKALLLTARVRSSQLAGLITLELGAYLFWRMFGSVAGVLIYCAVGLLIAGGLSALIFCSARTIAGAARQEWDSAQRGSGAEE
ncbi:MAG: hypothetical protein WBS54_13910 [Acidobacteriota bacterium]